MLLTSRRNSVRERCADFANLNYDSPMLTGRSPWGDELAIIDRVMKAVSGVTDPEELVGIYWTGISELLPIENYVAVSRRGVEPPHYLITRSARFTEHHNPW